MHTTSLFVHHLTLCCVFIRRTLSTGIHNFPHFDYCFFPLVWSSSVDIFFISLLIFGGKKRQFKRINHWEIHNGVVDFQCFFLCLLLVFLETRKHFLIHFESIFHFSYWFKRRINKNRAQTNIYLYMNWRAKYRTMRLIERYSHHTLIHEHTDEKQDYTRNQWPKNSN